MRSVDGTPRLYHDLAWVWPLLSPPEDYVEEAEVIVDEFRRLGAPPNGRLLHLGSGGGSLDWHLKRHFGMAGVDRSEPMARHAAKVNPEVDYWQADMLEVRLDPSFDGVLIHDAIAYLTGFEELRAVFLTAAAHLSAGGALVCLPEQIREQFRPHRVRSQTHGDATLSVTTVEVSFDPDPDDNWFETTFAYFIRENGRLRVELDTHRMGIFALGEFADAARSAGFEVEAVELHPSDMPPDEPYTLIVGRKR